MTPQFSGIDHAHVYVKDRQASALWYKEVLGFTPVADLQSWATATGPLTLGNAAGTVHLALFESEREPDSVIAFGSTGEQFLLWKAHLEARELEIRLANHDLAWSMYFHDPDGNYHEITTYDHAHVASQLG
jgi:catechol 2,3-dioxygenase